MSQMSQGTRSAPAPHSEALRRRIAHELFQQLAFTSFAIWTGTCLLLFILFAAGNPRPIPSAMIAMTAPVIPAALVWLAYRPLIQRRVARAMRAEAPAPSA